MNEFEYVTFELADYNNSPALRYRKICFDHTHGKDIPEFAFLDRLKEEMERKYTEAQLAATDSEELEFWVRKIAKQMAVDMLVSGKTSPGTMERAVALPDDAFERSVALCNEMAQELDIRVREIEGKYKKSNHSVDSTL